MVAAVKTARSEGPVNPLDEPDPRNVEIARNIAERMRVLADGAG